MKRGSESGRVGNPNDECRMTKLEMRMRAEVMRDSNLSAKRRGVRQPAAAVRSGSLLPGGEGGFVKRCLLSCGEFIEANGGKSVSLNYGASFVGSRLPVAYSGSRLPQSTAFGSGSGFVIRNSEFGFTPSLPNTR